RVNRQTMKRCARTAALSHSLTGGSYLSVPPPVSQALPPGRTNSVTDRDEDPTISSTFGRHTLSNSAFRVCSTGNDTVNTARREPAVLWRTELARHCHQQIARPRATVRLTAAMRQHVFTFCAPAQCGARTPHPRAPTRT